MYFCVLVFGGLAANQFAGFVVFNESILFEMILSEQQVQPLPPLKPQKPYKEPQPQPKLETKARVVENVVNVSLEEGNAAPPTGALSTKRVTVPDGSTSNQATKKEQMVMIKETNFSFYYPRVRNDTSTYFANDSWTNVPFLHILETPLIQNQLNLTLLIETRLDLFEAFCLPSIRQQTSRDFIWIVRVDTRLSTEHPQWLQRLVDLLAPDPRFYLIERDSNPPWRNGEATEQLTQSKVYTGNQRRLEYYMSAYAEKHILETRLDGDDGLHYQYLQYIADESMKILHQQPPPAFFYWCVAQEIEWHPVFLERRPGPFLERNTTPIEPLPPSPYTHGLWMPGPVYKDLCPTPGITRVYPLGTPMERVLQIGHHLLWRRFHNRKESCERPEDEIGRASCRER